MSLEPHLIAPFKNALSKYFKPWLIGEDAFPNLTDAYLWRGSIKKREGMRLLATFPNIMGVPDKPVQGIKNWINPSTLGDNLIGFSLIKSYFFNNASGLFQDMTFFAYPTGVGVPITGAAFSWSNGANDYFWTSNFAGSMWTTNNLTADHIKYWNGTPGVLNTSGGWSTFQPAIDGSGNTLDAALIILPYKGRLVALNTSEAGSVFQNRARYSQLGTPYAGAASPVTILTITAANPTAFTTSSDTFTTGQNISFFGVTGADSNLVNGVNGVVTRVGAGSYTVNINTAGKTLTSPSGFVQQLGNPPAPFTNDIFAWRSDIPGRGGFIDADTSQRIVSAEIIKDTLIVFFQRSTWRLTYTGNEILPFIWERLNTQYGAEATYSNVAFDEAVLSYSRFGWIASSTNDVARIDLEIPDESFQIEGVDASLNGLSHVQGIRDFYRNYAYWTFLPEGQTNNNLIYAYNYIEKKWTIFQIDNIQKSIFIKTFGTYRTLSDITWAVLNSATNPPGIDSWENYNDPEADKWENIGVGEVIDFPYILGGDTNGNVYQMFEFFRTPTLDNGNIYTFNITTKRFNPYINEGLRCRIVYVDLYFTDVAGGEIIFQHFIDDQLATPIITKEIPLSKRGAVSISSVVVGNPTTTINTVQEHNLSSNEVVNLSNILGTAGPLLNNFDLVATVVTANQFTVPVNTFGYTYTANTGLAYTAQLVSGDSKYTRIFLNVTAYQHQFVMTLNSLQQVDPVKGAAQFELQGIVLWTKRGARIKG